MYLTGKLIEFIAAELKDKEIEELKEQLESERHTNYPNSICINGKVFIGKTFSGAVGGLWPEEYNYEIAFDGNRLPTDWQNDRDDRTVVMLGDDCSLGSQILKVVKNGTVEKFKVTMILEKTE